jgi:uncharacterized membrane protein
MPDQPNLRQRIATLEARVMELEERLDSVPGAPRGRRAEQQLLAEARAAQDVLVHAAASHEPEALSPRDRATQTNGISPPLFAPSIPTTPAPRHRSTSAALAPPSRLDLERAIGGRIFAAVGAIVVVVGVGLFLQMAYRMGWMNLIPPAGKCLLGAVFGGGLLIAGELVRRRINAAASAGISAAGLGTLYASAWAAWNLQLVPAAVAFIMLALIAAVGFVVAARARSATLAVLALIGGYLNPFVIGGGGSELVMPTYLITLLAAGLTLSAWRARPFRILRSLIWWGTLLVGTLWTMVQGVDVPSIAIVFLGLVWAAMHAELAVSAGAIGIVYPGARRGVGSAGSWPTELSWGRTRFIATSFTTTIWTVALAAWLLRYGTPLSDWLAPAFAAALTIALASVLVGHLQVLREWPRTDLERLGAGLAMQGGGLLIAAVALALSGSAQVAAWLSLGLAAHVAGRWIRSRGLDLYGIVALSLGTARLLLIDAPYLTTPAWSYELEGIILSTWMILMVFAAAAWAVTSGLILRGLPETDVGGDDAVRRGSWTPSELWRNLGTTAAVLCPSLLLWAMVHPGADAGSVALIWLFVALGTLLVHRLLAMEALAAHAIVALGLSGMIMAAWLPNGGPGWTLASGAGLVLSRWTMLMLMFAGGCAIAAANVPSWRQAVQMFANSPGHSIAAHHVLSVLSAAGALAAFWHPDVSAASLALLWLVIAMAILTLHRPLPRIGFDLFAISAIGAAAISCAIAWVPDWMTTPGIPLLHGGFWSAMALLGAAAGWIVWLRGAPKRGSPGPTVPDVIPAVLATGGGLLLASTSLEIARSATVVTGDATARNAAVSIWWGLFAVALLVVGFYRQWAILRRAGLALLTVATVKAVVIDMAEVPPMWRVASFIALGLLMLGVAAVYLRISAMLEERPHRGSTEVDGAEENEVSLPPAK